MKFRLIIIVLTLTVLGSACSLAEDITPPAVNTYIAPIASPVPATQTGSQTEVPTYTPAFDATSDPNTIQVTPNSTLSSETSQVEGTLPAQTPESSTATPQPAQVEISGQVTGPQGTNFPEGLTASLLIYSMSSSEVAQTLSSPISSRGTYQFQNVPADETSVYFITVEFLGVTYESEPIQYDGVTSQMVMPVTVYNSSKDLSSLSISKAHLQFDFSGDGQVQVGLVYIITNLSGNAVIFPSSGSDIPFIQVPQEAINPQYQLDQSSAPLLLATEGYAFLPGADRQYVLITSFSLPYTGSLTYTQPFSPPVNSATVIVPDGVKVKSDQLSDGGTQPSAGTSGVTFHLYQVSNLAAGSTLSMKISGTLAKEGNPQVSQQTLLIAVAALGLLLVGLGVFLFVRERKLQRLVQDDDENAGEEGEITSNTDDSLGENRESIMDAIITLDDQFKAGSITKEAHEQRRNELKNRLKNLG